MVKNGSMWWDRLHQCSSLALMPSNCHFNHTVDSFFTLPLHIVDLSNWASFLVFSMLQFYISVLQIYFLAGSCFIKLLFKESWHSVSPPPCSPFAHSSKKLFVSFPLLNSGVSFLCSLLAQCTFTLEFKPLNKFSIG